MNNPAIYVACLAAYNNGIHYVKWIDAAQGVWQIEAAIQDMLSKSPITNAEEWSIHAYEGFGNIEIEENDSLELVDQLANFIILYGDLGIALLEENSIEMAETLIKEHYYGAFDDEVDFAYAIIEEL